MQNIRPQVHLENVVWNLTCDCGRMANDGHCGAGMRAIAAGTATCLPTAVGVA